MSMLSAAGMSRPAIKATEDHVAASKMSQERFISHLCIKPAQRIFRRSAQRFSGPTGDLPLAAFLGVG
jgi:hypothetical protein